MSELSSHPCQPVEPKGCGMSRGSTMTERYRIRIVEKGQATFVVLSSTKGGWHSTQYEGAAWTCSRATAEATARQIKRQHPSLLVKVEIVP